MTPLVRPARPSPRTPPPDLADPVFLDEANEDDRTYQGRLFWPSGFRDEVLARLLALNAERAAAEQAAGLAPLALGEEEKDEVDV